MKAVTLYLSLLILCRLTIAAQADVPKLINYQGKLTTPEGACLDTTVSMQFAIYSDSTGWDSLWSETQASIKVDKGVFNVLLGSVNEIPESVFTGGIRYLGVKVENDPEMVPRKAIVSVGYSFRSDFAKTAENALSAPPDDDWDIDTSGFNIYRFTGNVGIGTTATDDARLYVKIDTAVWKYAIYADGGRGVKSISTALAGIGVSGEGGHAGVAGYGGYIGTVGQGYYGGWFEGMGYFSGNVGIGTTEPDENLEVDGNAHITGDLTVDGSINSIRLKVYDSGWFPCSYGQWYDLTHNLGTTKLLIQIYFSDVPLDSNAQPTFGTFAKASGGTDEGVTGARVTNITQTSFRIVAGAHYAGSLYTKMGGYLFLYQEGYYKVIALALE